MSSFPYMMMSRIANTAHLNKRQDQRFKEIDEMSAALLRFPNNRLATFTCSFGAADRSLMRSLAPRASSRWIPPTKWLTT
jgi:hypothetical protein